MSATSRRKKALGRGLDALLPGSAGSERESVPAVTLQLDRIDPNPYQPRRAWSDEDLRSLADSIAASGLIQPLVVRRRDGRYQLIAGERRLRAAKLAGLSELPVVVRQATDSEMLALALIENIQRKDLGPIEKAEAFQRLLSEFDMTQEELAGAVGLSRPSVANFVRLLDLPAAVKELLRDGSLTMGHGRALLGLEAREECERTAKHAAARDLSVRETEELVRRGGLGSARKRRAQSRKRSPEVRMLEQRLERRLGTRVRVMDRGGTGRIDIAYSSLDELDRILDLLGLGE